MSRVVVRRVHYLTKNTKNIKIGFARYSSNIIRSPFKDIVIPSATLPEYIFKNFSKFPDKIALECAETGRKYTFEEVRRKSINLNKALRKVLKLKQDDIVAVVLPNLPEYPICFFGSILANLKVTTVNPGGTSEEIKRQLQDTNSKAIFTTCSLENHIRQTVQKLSKPVPVIAIKSKASDTIPQGFISFNELVDGCYDIEDKYFANPSEVVVIPYSSGTTGLQKGVLHSHSTLVALTAQICSSDVDFIKPVSEIYQEVVPIVLPFFHIYGLTSLLICQLSALSKLITIGKFTPDVLLNVLEKHKPRTLCLVPPLALFLTNSPSVTKKHLESLEYIISGAAPLGAADEERLSLKSEKKVNVFQGYGLTEAPVATVSLNITDCSPGSVGYPIQNTEVKIVPVDNPYGEPLGKYEEGEIFIKGPQVMLGYYNRIEATENIFANGWLRTGDLGYFDEHNHFYVKDRLKELIKVKGYQVAPAELEELIRGYPNVSDAVVIGIPHDKYGEVPRAYITLKSKTMIDLKELEQFVASNVSNYKQIQGGFSVIDTIPKTASGKYLRKDLKSMYIRDNI